MMDKPVRGGWYFHPFEIAISGFSGSGKTTLAEKLITSCERRGFQVAFFKRDAHRFAMDTPGKDTWRAGDAGASIVAIEDRRHSAVIARHGPLGASRSLVQQSVSGADILFIEGRKDSHIPKLLLLDPRYEIEQSVAGIDGSSVLAVVYPHGQAQRATVLAREISGLESGKPVPVYCRDDLTGIIAELDAHWAARIAPLRGLVLIGGKSTRMGRDKSGIEYRHGVSAARRSVNIVASVCGTVSLAVRPGQHVPDDVAEVPRIEDRFVDFGPAGAILTALHDNPTAAWLTVGCDMPLLGEDDVQELIAHRDPFKIATSAAGPGYAQMREHAFSPDGNPLLPEPLCSIWEPRSRGRIFSFFQEGVTAPRWMLRNGAVKMVELSNEWATYNANTPEDAALARLAVSSRTPGGGPPGHGQKTPGTPTPIGSAPV